jgi:hypothetical protein
VQYQISHCNLPTCYEVECLAGHNEKTLNNAKTTIVGNPFVVYSDEVCTPVGLTDAELERDLYNQLVVGEQATVENAFSAQLCGQSPGLANNAAVSTLTAATDVVDAVASLEAALYAVYGAPGVLHVPMILAAYFEYLHLAEQKDSRGIWRTKAGTAVNFGNYQGLSAAGGAPAAGHTFIYITGQTAVWRTPDSDLFVTSRRDVLNRSTNQLTAVMEREYVVAFDCAVFAVDTPISGVVT